jgi:hypothetical protein
MRTLESTWRTLESTWGSGAYVDQLAPSVAKDPSFRRWWARFERHIHSPGSLLAFLRLQAGVDVRAVLPSVSSPTLLLQRSGDVYRDPGNSRYLAEMIPGGYACRTAGSRPPSLCWRPGRGAR